MRGISRLKYHLAQLIGHEVDICKNFTPKIIHRTKLVIEGIGKRKDERDALRKELGIRAALGSRIIGHTLGEVGSETLSSTSTVPSFTSPFFVPRFLPSGQSSIRSMVKIEVKKEADKLEG